MNTFSNRMRTLRLEKELTQSELGEIFKKTKSCISSYEQRGRFPDENLLKEYAKYFGVSIDFLLGMSDVRNPISTDTKTFVQSVIDSLIKSGDLKDEKDLDSTMVGLIISAIKMDIKKRKDI